MKVAKKVRLLTKDKNGLFQNNKNYEVLRNKAVVQESVIEETESNYKSTGVLYLVDEKATKEWHKEKEQSNKA